MGHRFSFLWRIHRHHHMFYNPSPFAVIADEFLDQFVRTLPMIILPLLTPINMDLLFTIFASLFYGYGVYLHWGYESSISIFSAHNLVFNTAYHHYTHHALSAKGRPIYTGFFFKGWDWLFGTTVGTDKCRCWECRPPRTRKLWEETIKPDYSVLLSLPWWLSSSSLVND
jgi:lathosterol oxidase